jgi:hypothetical protein
MTPLPHAASFEALNAALAERCRARQGNMLAGMETIGERLMIWPRSAASPRAC